MTDEITDIHKLRKLAERYPFNEEELEILVRCHEDLQKSSAEDQDDDFLLKLARASPYTFFFLPGDELRDRVEWIEEHILPAGFANQLRAAISANAFVEYANQGEDKTLEQFLEGIAETGRRGSKEALRLLYRLLDQPEAEELMDICVRLALASAAFMNPNLDKKATLTRLEDMEPAIGALTNALESECGEDRLTLNTFVDWAEEYFPLLSTTLSTFVHALLFHGRPYPTNRFQYEPPKFDTSSNIFSNPSNSPSLMTLSMTSEYFRGKWHRIYSSFLDGRSFNRLEWSLLGYSGPTLFLVKTTGKAVLGAFAASPWKEGKDFHGSSECFLFEIEPNLNVHRCKGNGNNFMYLHSKHTHADPVFDGPLFGLGFGGTPEKPRLFIPETFDHCSAHFLDKTFRQGELLPVETLEKFEIQQLEVWGVGGDEAFTKALRDRAERRERSDSAILRARIIQDKSVFAKDMQTGLIPSSLYDHQAYVRGRQAFMVDDEHGGYKVDHDAD